MRTAKRFVPAFGVPLLTVAGYGAFLQPTGNVHEVSKGQVYRAAQLDAAQVLEPIEALKAAPKPVPIDCRGGADRTGLAAAL
ncbi:hypothetical protein SAMN06265378_103229 [Paracoccus sediminis]|uniref:Tyrosine phosphatase family protein n=1 Tax=Paracoccus sediminis TaxID=1214787 RepID=A0A238W0J5_9RHOB|nr:hypothetical protein SAMN06265378_103229 [Paracoccus sediminis]